MRLVKAIIFLTLLFSVSLSFADNDKGTKNFKNIPMQISKFYSDYNFVSLFSSESERKLILTADLSGRDIPDKFKSERIERIRNLINRLKIQVMQTDPEIVYPRDSSNQYKHHSELIKIDTVQRNNNELVIKLFAYDIDPRINKMLISQYDNNKYKDEKEKLHSEEESIQLSNSNPRIQIHTWILTDGMWMKKDFDVLLLEDRNEINNHLEEIEEVILEGEDKKE